MLILFLYIPVFALEAYLTRVAMRAIFKERYRDWHWIVALTPILLITAILLTVMLFLIAPGEGI